MLVHIVCGYRSKSDEWDDKWTDVHYRARNLVKAVKREPFKGFSIWKTSTKPAKEFKVDNTPSGQKIALLLAASKMSKLLTEAGIESADIVPIPSSDHITLDDNFTGGRIANAIHTANPSMQAKPVLHFATPQLKSHDDGSRNPSLILPHLRSGPLSGLHRVVLVDDVMTSGGHLRAARRYLEERNIKVVAGVVIGRTVWQKPDDMFRMPAEELPF